MAVTISNDTPVALSENWGVSFNDYTINGKQVDFQDLMVWVSEKRAVAVEGEVTPLTGRISIRNKNLDRAGSLLAVFTKAQSMFKNDDSGDTTTSVSGITSDQYAIVREAWYRRTGQMQDNITDGWVNTSWKKSSVEGMVQALKSMIDGWNNLAQKDMNRLQSLVDRRDESYSTATNLMNAISDTRSN
ncbi:MAG: hypothetical protein J6U40_07005 [Kiritimatiellae bacterium]|nr:hypothetical protein [Kiritimatiellia bacterium]